jgi:hypothetical protein
MKRTFGKGDDSLITRKKNAFRFPNDKESEYPQAEKPVYIDKRAKYAKTEYLVKEIGLKKKNVEKKNAVEARYNALLAAEARAEGREREDDVIEMNDLADLDDNFDVEKLDLDKFTLNDNKKSKNKRGGMDVEDTSARRQNINKKRKKKNKSYYLVNY